MEVYKRPFKDPVLSRLKEFILKHHKTSATDRNLLLSKLKVKGFTACSRHFAILGEETFLSYDTETFNLDKKGQFGLKITKITLYKDIQEYTAERSVIYKGDPSKVEIPLAEQN